MVLDKNFNKIKEEEIVNIIKGKEVIIYGDSTRNGQLFDMIGLENIFCIVDKNEDKQGTKRKGIPICPIDVLSLSKNIIVFTVIRDYENLPLLFNKYGIEEFYYADTNFGEKYLEYFVWNDTVAEVNREFNKEKIYKYVNFIPDNKFIEPLFYMLKDYFDIRENVFIIYSLNKSNKEDRYHIWELYRQWGKKYKNIFLIDNLVNLKQKNILEQLEEISDCIFNSGKILLHSGYFSLQIEDFFYSHLPRFQEKAELLGWNDEYKSRRLDGAKRIYGECKYIYNRGADFYKLAEVYQFDKRKEKKISNHSGYSYYRIPPEKAVGDKTKILLGFGARPELLYMEAIDALCHFADKDIEIYCPLSYGNMLESEIMEIENYGKKVFGDKFKSLREFISYQQFPLFLNDMDIVIMPIKKCVGQTTIRLAMLCNKKIYVKNKEETCIERMKSGYQFYDYEDIETQNFDDFIHYSYKEKNKEVIRDVLNIQNRISTWKQIYNL